MRYGVDDREILPCRAATMGGKLVTAVGFEPTTT